MVVGADTKESADLEIWEARAGRSGVQGQLQLHSEFEISLVCTKQIPNTEQIQLAWHRPLFG